MNIFPQLRKLENKYRHELAVVGVHSAKFLAEKSTENVRQAILRYDIEHPVVNDADFAVWNQYGVRAWPTLIFIDPEGMVIGKHEGEISLDAFDQVIQRIVSEFDERGLMDRSPLIFKLERDKERERPLSFPGKVLTDLPSGRLVIADSNHNRLLVCSLDGQVRHIVGSGKRGLADGPFHEARFQDPQGMDLRGDLLYVADTNNHAIRIVNLAAQTVTTVAGTGEQAKTFHRGGPGRSTDLNSPWDVSLVDESLYIAMAGFHQLWRLDLATHNVSPHAGSGREQITDGPLPTSALAQPSGIVTGEKGLYFTDSETSAIRVADTDPRGTVSTIVGLGLFEFGDVDGVGPAVRLQHPMGIATGEGLLFITDSYNNKIKKVFPTTRAVATFLGSGRPGHRDGPADAAEFHEPGGLSVAGDRIYVADTNNHAIRVADLSSGQVSTLDLKGL